MSARSPRKGHGLRRTLFLCEDNHLASRFCEEFFNSLVRDDGLNWQAISRAYVSPSARAGDEPMAAEAVARLRSLGAAPVNHRRLPLAAHPRDFELSYLVIALVPRDERHALAAAWPQFASLVEYWPLDPAAPFGETLDQLASSVLCQIDWIRGPRPGQTATRVPPVSGRSDKLRSRGPAPAELGYVASQPPHPI